MAELKRDPRGSMSYWNTWTVFSESSIDAMWRQINEGVENEVYKPQFLFDIARRHADLLLYRHSRGDAVQAIASKFDGLLVAWEESDRVGAKIWDKETYLLRRSWAKNLDFYNLSFRLIGMAILLDVPDSQWRRLLALIGNNGEDAVLNTVIAYRSPGRVIGSHVCFPRAYKKLHQVLLAEPCDRPALLLSYLEGWFEGLEGAGCGDLDRAFRTPYWWKLCADEAHVMKGGYFGCWSVEAAVVAKALAIDDDACLTHVNYPVDLLADGRSPRYVDIASPFEPAVEADDLAQRKSWLSRILKRK
nr:PoNe immunity protein domain-containing protein [Stenotrophomonas sp. PS02301]